MPPHQSGDDQDVQRGDRPPSRWQERRCRIPSAESSTCSAISAVTVSVTPRTIAAIFSGVGRCCSGCRRSPRAPARPARPGQVGEDADDLRPEVVAAAFAAQRCARAVGVRPWRNPTNSPVTLSACAVKVSRWQAG
ncbi:putative arabinosyltransferase C domain protein [Mycobacterium xenopi 4042]|uniref:Putative arabinosyltransferase C domain protein n=1 Tax=Mycobacterium xenopi 4042 TaxID=1299334 RepID=X8DK20_MYCXE|nr:putative arabinosyltransferase C domain protein [Mycobacterium xenopi 4042]